MKLLIYLLTFFLFTFQASYADRFIPKSDLIFKVLDIVNHLYVDQNRIQPLKMLEGSLERLSVNIAPVLTELQTESGKVKIDVRVDQFRRSFSFDTPQNISDLNYILQQVVGFTKQYLEEDEQPESVDYAIINGFLHQLDPHSSLLIPEIYEDFSTQTSGNFGGVGMMISIKDGSLTVISPIDNTPASKAGLKANDTIVQINEESTVNMSLSDAVKKLRGKEGSEVDLYIMRKAFPSPKKITIVRDIIEINSVKSFSLEENDKRVGLLKINTFQQNTIDEINAQLDDLDYDLKDFYGLIIDLRNNPGGLLDQAIKVSDRFLNDGVIVSTAGLSKGSIRSFNAHWFRSITKIPMIVLINNGSASASEIVAAAFKKNNRGVVLGIQTFGKGSVQQVIPFAGGSALRLTTSKYLTPGNISIQSIGVSPHVSVEPYYVSNEFLHITKPKLDRGENSLDQNFSEWGDQAELPLKSIFYLYDNEENDEEEEINSDDLSIKALEKQRLESDFLVQSAVQILVRNNRKGFNNLLSESLAFLEKQQIDQEQKLIERFSEFSHSIDWNSYEVSGLGEIEVKTWIEIKSEENELWKPIAGAVPANSEIRLFLEAKNIGQTRISRLMATSESENQLFDDRQFAFGKLERGESRNWYVPIEIAKNAPARNDLIRFRFIDETKKELAQTTYSIQTLKKERPEFQYSISILDNGEGNSKGNGDGIIDAGERIALKVNVSNIGKGSSGALTLLLKNGEGKNVFLNAGRQDLSELKPGDSQIAMFDFDLKQVPADEDLDFSMDIIDSVFTLSSLNQKLKIPVGEKISPFSNAPPRITLNNTKLVSNDRRFRLFGNIADEGGVKDVYIFNNNKKIFYKNYLDIKNRSLVEFELDFDLDEEIHKITIVSRDEENVTTQKNLFVRLAEFK